MTKKRKPSQVTLIFDGDCGFCTSAANWVVAHSKFAIVAVPHQRTDLAQFGLDSSRAAAKVQLNVDGENFAGHRCFAKILLLQPNRFLRALGVIALLPVISQIAAVIYWVVAKNRHRLPGGTPACKLP